MGKVLLLDGLVAAFTILALVVLIPGLIGWATDIIFDPGGLAALLDSDGIPLEPESVAFEVGAAPKITESKSADGGLLTNSLGMAFKLIPAGEFVMGASSGDRLAFRDESPRHRVKITKAFYMGVYEVTQEQYLRVMENNPSVIKGSDRPVENVTWSEAKTFCEGLSLMTGLTYRLPSEAEWEYACRAGTTSAYYWGESTAENFAWFKDNSEGSINLVGRKIPNAWGLYDMSGNVWEWCLDDYGSYSGRTQSDPFESNYNGEKVYRGGSSAEEARILRASNRRKLSQWERTQYLGFRVVRHIKE